MTLKEALDKQQLGIDCMVAADCFREGTRNHEINYTKGVELLTEVRDFMLALKSSVGDFKV